VSKKSKRKKHKQPATHEQPVGENELSKHQEQVHVRGNVEANFPPDLVKKYDTGQNQQNAWHRKNFIAQVVTAFIVFAYTSIAFWQGCSASRTANVATESLDTIKKQFQLDQRPRVGLLDTVFSDPINFLKPLGIPPRKPTPKNEQVRPRIGEPMFVNISIKNFGKSPALNLVTHRHLLFGPTARFKGEPASDPQSGVTLQAGDTQNTTAASLKDTYANETAMLSLPEIVTWGGSEPIVVFGRISYEDSFGHKYCTPYARKYLPAGGQWEILPMTGAILQVPLCPKDTTP